MDAKVMYLIWKQATTNAPGYPVGCSDDYEKAATIAANLGKDYRVEPLSFYPGA